MTQDGTYLINRASTTTTTDLGQAYREATTSTNWVVFGMVIDPTTPTTGTMTSLYNGEAMSQWFRDAGSLTGAFTESSRFSVGWSAPAAGMELAEILVYNRALSETEWGQVGATLANKYDITTTYVIPEPATAAVLLGLAALALLITRRRK